MVGIVAFCVKFIEHGRFLIDSSYATIVTAQCSSSRKDMVIVTHEIAYDRPQISKQATQDARAPITVSPLYRSPGREGFRYDGALKKVVFKADMTIAQGGLGLHMFVHNIAQKWWPGTLELVSRRRLSISPLELLAADAAIELLPTSGQKENR